MKKGLKSGVFNVLSDMDIERIHAASLSLLEEMGVYSDSNLIVDICAKNGAVVDSNSKIIKISSDMVEEALKTTPDTLTLYGRNPENDLLLESDACYFGMGGSPVPHIWDYNKKKRVAATKEDMENCTRLAEYLNNIDFVGALCTSGDKAKETQLFHDYHALFHNTSKPLIYSAPGPYYTSWFIEMAAIASGGRDELRKRPSIALFTETVSPMKVGKYSEGMVEAAENGVPIILALAPMMGATSPASRAGTLAQSNAEALFKLVLSQFIRPGTPVIFGPGTGTFDMATGQYTYGSPEQTLTRGVIAQLGRYYELPVYNLGGGVEAKLPDAEAGAQAMMGILHNSMTGITLTKNLGTLASGLYGSQEMLIICDEIVYMTKSIRSGIEVSDESLALDVVKEVGHHGNFLAHEHTSRKFRDEFFFPNFFKRQSISKWEEDGCKSMMDVAHEKKEEILKKTKSLELSAHIDDELNRALEEATAGVLRGVK